PVSSGRFTRAIRVSSYSRTGAHKSFSFRIRGHYPLGPCFPARSAMKMICNLCRTSSELLPYHPLGRSRRFGLFPFRSPLFGESRETCSIRTNIMRRRNTARSCFIFLSVLRCFTSRGALLKTLLNRYSHTRVGCPIRRPPDRWLQIASPELSLISCVLLRCLKPRHPPCTLHVSCAET